LFGCRPKTNVSLTGWTDMSRKSICPRSIIPDNRDKYDTIEISLEPIRLLTKRRTKQQRFQKPAVIPETAELDDDSNNQD
jgi:hypothetical protein